MALARTHVQVAIAKNPVLDSVIQRNSSGEEATPMEDGTASEIPNRDDKHPKEVFSAIAGQS